ncbi:MAG: NAD(P)H-dependent oxidoreductase [Deltaproteobacteria bacterium]|nr:NAD(P)H-dependent oxidoreductase [Deltaproteobacteria bacterium]
MKNATAALAVAALILALAPRPAAAQAQPGGAGLAEESGFGKALVIVYSVTGNTMNMAERIRARVGADIVRIETVESYPEGDQLIPYAKKERDELRKPTLKGPLPDVGPYDMIFIGSPVWFHGLPAATSLFLAAMDFQGKPLAPFLTAGGGPGEAMAALRGSARNARLLEHRVITRYSSRPDEDIDREIDSWLKILQGGPPPPGLNGGTVDGEDGALAWPMFQRAAAAEAGGEPGDAP